MTIVIGKVLKGLYIHLPPPLKWKIPICRLYVHLYTLHVHVGAQLREWLLYFSLPVLKGILPAPQLDHYCYLVVGIHIVLSDFISAADLSCADRCLRQFYSQFTNIYGNNYGECEAFTLIAYTVQPEILPGETFLLYPLILLLCVNDYILEPVASFTAWRKIYSTTMSYCISIIQRWLGETFVQGKF